MKVENPPKSEVAKFINQASVCEQKSLSVGKKILDFSKSLDFLSFEQQVPITEKFKYM